MRIVPKYQDGGLTLPLLEHTPSTGGSVTGPPSLFSPTREKEEQKSILDENMMKQLYQKGLASDVEAFLTLMQNAILHPTDPFGRPNYQNYKAVMTYLTKVTVEKERFDEAIKEVKKNGGMYSPVVNDDGYILVAGKRGTEWRDPDKLTKQDRVITNGMLARARANNAEYAFNSDYTEYISQGIGPGALQGIIDDAVKNLGSDETRMEGPVSVKNQQILKGIEFLQNATRADAAAIVSGSGDLNVSIEDKNNIVQATAALAFIKNIIPTNLRSVLKWQAVQQGVTMDDIILQSISSKYNSKHNLKVEAAKSTEAKDPYNDPMGPVQMWYSGLGGKFDTIILHGTQDGIHVHGNVAPITNKNGEALGVTTLDKVTNSTFGASLDWQSVHMGDQKVNMQSLNQILVDTGQIYMMELPIDAEATSRGIIKPDLNFLPLIEKAEEKIRAEQIDVNTQEGRDAANKIYEDLKIPVKYKEGGGKEITAAYHRFGVLNGTASSLAFNQDDYQLSSWLKEVTNEHEINNAIAALYPNKEDKAKFDTKSWYNLRGGSGYDHIIEGTVFIPVVESYMQSLMGSGNTPTIKSANEFYEPLEQQRNRQLRGIIDGGMP